MTIEEMDELKSLADVEDFFRSPQALSKDGAKKMISIITNLKKVSGESESHADGLTDDEREAQAKEEQKQKEATEAQQKQNNVNAKALADFANALTNNKE